MSDPVVSQVVTNEAKSGLIATFSDFLKTKPTLELLLIIGVGIVSYGLFEFLPKYGIGMEASHREERKAQDDAHREERKEWRLTIERSFEMIANQNRRAGFPPAGDVAGGK